MMLGLLTTSKYRTRDLDKLLVLEPGRGRDEG